MQSLVNQHTYAMISQITLACSYSILLGSVNVAFLRIVLQKTLLVYQ